VVRESGDLQHGEMRIYDPECHPVTLSARNFNLGPNKAGVPRIAHIAMGAGHYFGRRDYRGALDEFTIALEGLPNDAELWKWIGFIHRRMGNWNEVLAAFDKAAQLDPRDANLFSDLGNTYRVMHPSPMPCRMTRP
jgi:tetratricopeptide (TPR) repeat protein